jgi:hypothetical protein
MKTATAKNASIALSKGKNDELEKAKKYLLPEKVDHGSIVLFDPKTRAGELCAPQKHVAEGNEILIFNIAIGR